MPTKGTTWAELGRSAHGPRLHLSLSSRTRVIGAVLVERLGRRRRAEASRGPERKLKGAQRWYMCSFGTRSRTMALGDKYSTGLPRSVEWRRGGVQDRRRFRGAEQSLPFLRVAECREGQGIS